MVFNSIPQFPWSSSRTPHPTERNDFGIFTSNCPIWKKISAKTAKSIHSPILPYHQHKQINLQLYESLQNTPKKTHFTRHVTTTLSMLEAGNGLFLSHKPLCWRIVDCQSLQTARVSRAAKQNPAQTPFLAFFGMCDVQTISEKCWDGVWWLESANKCPPPKKIREVFHYIM